LGIHPRPDMTWEEKKKMYDKLQEIKRMGPVYNPWLSTYQRHVRWSEHNLLVEQVEEQLKFKPLFKSTEAGRQRCREYTAIVNKIYEKEKATGAPIPDLSLANDSDDEMAPSSSSKMATRSSRKKRTFSGSVKTEPIDEDEQYFNSTRPTASYTRPEYSHFLPGQSSNIVLPGPPVPVMLPDGYAPRFEETRREHAPEQAPTTVKMYECTICNLRLKSLSMLNIHIQKHSKKCLKCGIKFNRFDELQKHGPYCMRANGIIVIPPRPKPQPKPQPPPKPKKWHICRLCEEKFDHPRRLYWHQVKRCKKRYVSKSWVVKI